MTNVDIFLAAVALIAVICLVLACVRIERLMADVEDARAHDHTDCTKEVMLAVGDKHEANVLRLAALAHDSVEGRREREVLSRVDSPFSAGALWLTKRANAVERGLQD